jgi:hypothetical protein
MTIEQAYIQFINLVDRNATNNNISVDKIRFVLMFNDIQNRYVEWLLEKRNEDAVRYIAPLLQTNVQISKVSTYPTYDTFQIPKDYFDFANLSVTATKGSCKRQRLYTFEVKSEDVEELMADVDNRPSFEFRETFYYTGDKKINVFKTDFSLDEAFLTYYRYPRQVSMEGTINLDNTNSQNINPEWDDKVTGRILLAMAKEHSAINADGASYQLDKDRVFSEI